MEHHGQNIVGAYLFLNILYSSYAALYPYGADYYIPMEDKTGGGGNVGLQDVNGGPTVVQGVVGNALHYQGFQASKMGTNTRSNCFEDIHKCPDGFTVAFWLRVDSFNGIQTLDTGGRHGWSRGWVLKIIDNRRLEVHFRGFGNGVSLSVDCELFSKGRWRHVAIQYKAFNARLFIDGDRIAESSEVFYLHVGDEKPQPYIGQTTMGLHSGNNDMYVDDLLHWNRILSDEIIEKITECEKSFQIGPRTKSGVLIKKRPCMNQYTVILDDVTVKAKLECANVCAERVYKSFYYHPQNGSCITHNTRMALWEMSDNYWEFYELN